MKQKSKKKENQRKFLPLKNVKHRLCFDSLSVTVCEHRRPSPSPPSSSSAPQREGSPKDLSKNLTSLRKGAPTTHFSLLSLSLTSVQIFFFSRSCSLFLHADLVFRQLLRDVCRRRQSSSDSNLLFITITACSQANIISTKPKRRQPQ